MEPNEQIFNKLVRDKIPDKMISNGEEVFLKILDDEEYKLELERKLYEEYNEVLNSTGEERIEEIADMLEVLISLAKIENKSLDDILEVAAKKREKRGSFDNKIFLEKTRGK